MAEGKRRILIVDDEPSLAKIVRKQLEVAGYEVDVAVDGEDGLAKARAWNPELIVLDLMIPKLTGYEVCKALKADPQYRHIPIIMLTAKSQQQDYQEAMQHGAQGYLTKPFSLQELLEKIATLLRPGSTPPS